MRELRLRRARKAARDLLRMCGLEREVPVPVEDIAHALGIEIVVGELKGALASLVRVGRRARIRVSEDHSVPGQLRFSIAHEIGHFVLEHRVAGRLSDAVANGWLQDKGVESEADAFAAELLMPEATVRRRCEVSPVDFEVVRGIADDFDTSPVAAAVRFAELNSERVATVFAQDSRVRWAVRSPSYWPEIRRGQALLPWSLAARYFQGQSLPELGERVDAAAWIDGARLREPVAIVEHAVPLDQLAGVLSVIWIPEAAHALSSRSF